MKGVMNNQQNKALIVLNVVALSPYMIGKNTPNINKLLANGYSKNNLAAETKLQKRQTVKNSTSYLQTYSRTACS